MKPFTKKIVLESGREFYGYGFGADREATGEIVFNTSMVGYQEILSDPSYAGQIVTMAAPEIGNTGTNPDDDENREAAPRVAGFIVRSASLVTSNYRSTESLDAYLTRHRVVALWRF